MYHDVCADCNPGHYSDGPYCRGIIRASSRENLSSGFPTKRVSNQSPQLQRLARKLQFHLLQVYI